MAFKSGLFQSTEVTVVNGIAVGNKALSTEQFAKRFYHIYGDGISLKPTSAFYVAPKSGLIFTVSKGWGIKSGYDFELDADLDITLNSSTNEQTLYVGVRLDLINGEYTGNNVVARTTFIAATDVVFAIIVIPANAITLTVGMISDTRNLPTYCGVIDSQRLALTDIYNEYRDALIVLQSTGVPTHHGTHAAGSSDAITPASIGAEAARLQFINTLVVKTAFISDATYSDYPYRASVALSGVVTAMVPHVVLHPSDAKSGKFAPVAACYNGGVYLYAASVPATDISVPTIICWR